MAKPYQIQQVNEETGELQDVALLLAEYYKSKGLAIMADVHDGQVRTEDIRIFERRVRASEEERDFSHVPEELREDMVDMGSNAMFSKVFQLRDPNFTKVPYYAYWFKICVNLSRDTNIIMNRKPKKHFIGSTKELSKICKCSEPAIYRFAKECREKGLIATFKLQGKEVFVANPHYALNGRWFPHSLAKLFDDTMRGEPNED